MQVACVENKRCGGRLLGSFGRSGHRANDRNGRSGFILIMKFERILNVIITVCRVNFIETEVFRRVRRCDRVGEYSASREHVGRDFDFIQPCIRIFHIEVGHINNNRVIACVWNNGHGRDGIVVGERNNRSFVIGGINIEFVQFPVNIGRLVIRPVFIVVGHNNFRRLLIGIQIDLVGHIPGRLRRITIARGNVHIACIDQTIQIVVKQGHILKKPFFIMTKASLKCRYPRIRSGCGQRAFRFLHFVCRNNAVAIGIARKIDLAHELPVVGSA